MFSVLRVDSRTAESLEPLGTKPKFWYRVGGTRWLYKAEERGTGEDWAEKIACELCTLLGLPHVHYELAADVAKDIPGVVCETCAPPPYAMGLGNQLLQTLDANYPEGRKYKVREHTVDHHAERDDDIELTCRQKFANCRRAKLGEFPWRSAIPGSTSTSPNHPTLP